MKKTQLTWRGTAVEHVKRACGKEVLVSLRLVERTAVSEVRYRRSGD